MQVTETLNEGLKRAYTVNITADELEAKVNEKLEEARPEIEIKGFRKGKVPMALLKKQFGPRVMGEAMQESIDGAVAKHFEESGDKPAAQPAMKMTNEDWKEGDDIDVEFSYEALPEIPEVDFSGISLEKLVVKPAETEINDAIERLADTAKTFDTKEGAAESGDQVVMDFLGRVDGEAFEGGSSEDFPLELGSGQFIPGFEEQLEGVSAGDEKDVTVTFPEEYNAAHLAGKEAVFSCTIKEVKSATKAEINDALAENFGAENLDGLKEQITERFTAEYAGAARQVTKRALLDQLADLVSFELPPSLVEAEAKQIAYQLAEEESSEEENAEAAEVEPTDEHITLAERRVRLGLLLADVGQKKEITVSDAEMTQAIMNQARQYPGQERAFFDFVRENPQAQQGLRAPLFEDKVIDYIVELAEVTEKEVDKEALEKAVEALDD